MASKLTGTSQSRLNDAAQKASQFGQVNSKREAIDVLKQAGIDNSFLDRAKSMLDNPIARTLAGAAGLDVKQMGDAIDELEAGNGRKSPSPQAQTGNPRMQSLRSGLKHLKK